MASKGLAALPRIDRDALGRGCGRKGSGALPLPRAAVISTRLRVHMPAVPRPMRAANAAHLVTARGRVRVGIQGRRRGRGKGVGLGRRVRLGLGWR